MVSPELKDLVGINTPIAKVFVQALIDDLGWGDIVQRLNQAEHNAGNPNPANVYTFHTFDN